MTFFIAAAAGAACGIISGFGIGGGTLLIIYMTLIAGIGQQAAQGINLIYFIPASLSALFWHIKNKLVDKNAAVFSASFGAVSALAASFAASSLPVDTLKKVFGVFLIILGAWELFKKDKKTNVN